MNRRSVVFLINLIQDVNIIRPLAYLAAAELDVSIAFMISSQFRLRDKTNVWIGEVEDIAQDVDAEIVDFENEFAAYQWLSNRHGALIAASESNLSAHHEVHNVFRVAPDGFVKITLQHGLECIGFLQNREHDKAHGRNVRFGADIVAGWLPAQRMASMGPTERSKLTVTGPGLLIQGDIVSGRGSGAEGLVCENLHSVRLNASGDFKAGFMDVFFQFCDELLDAEQTVALRPHPGGQYVLKNKVSLPDNVVLANEPIYRTCLKDYRYGISAPSSVVLDMVMAGIPTAVWRDGDGVMDVRNYDGLTMISGLDDWLAFRRDALKRPEMILDKQRLYLQKLGIPTDTDDVRGRFRNLLDGSSRRSGLPSPPPPARPAKAATETAK